MYDGGPHRSSYAYICGIVPFAPSVYQHSCSPALYAYMKLLTLFDVTRSLRVLALMHGLDFRACASKKHTYNMRVASLSQPSIYLCTCSQGMPYTFMYHLTTYVRYIHHTSKPHTPRIFTLPVYTQSSKRNHIDPLFRCRSTCHRHTSLIFTHAPFLALSFVHPETIHDVRVYARYVSLFLCSKRNLCGTYSCPFCAIPAISEPPDLSGLHAVV